MLIGRKAYIAPSDADAGDQLIAYLEERGYRISLFDLFDLFGANKRPQKKALVVGLLMDLMEQDRLIEVERDLYCLPALRQPRPIRDVPALAKLPKDRSALRLKPLRRGAPKIAERRGPDPGSDVEQWMLRKIRSCGFAADLFQLVNEVLYAGIADDDESAFAAVASMLARGWIERLDGRAVILTSPDGIQAAEHAWLLARAMGEQPLPMRQEFAPNILWIDDE